MFFVEIDVAKDRHNCFIIRSKGDILADVFTIANSKEGLFSICVLFAAMGYRSIMPSLYFIFAILTTSQ